MHEFTREDYEHAARAAGLEVVPHLDRVYQHTRIGTVEWNPATDDGDAFRLMVKLGTYINGKFTAHQRVQEFVDLGELTAVRHAIFRAAIEIGKSMAQKGHLEHR